MGIIPTIASYLVPVLLHRQQSRHGELELTLQERTTGNLLNEIRN